MSASFGKRFAEVRTRLVVGFIFNLFLVPLQIPDFNGSVANQVLAEFIAGSIGVAALVCLAGVFLKRFMVWQAIAAGLLMLVPVFALTTGLMFL
jgi:hypothetical protein